MKNEDTRLVDMQKPFWFSYPKSNQILETLEGFLNMKRNHRMPNLLIMANSNMGKTLIARRFLKKHPPYTYEQMHSDYGLIENLVWPVIMVECPYKPNERLFFKEILKQVNMPHRPSSNTETLFELVVDTLQKVETRVLLLDEVHNILSGSAANQRVFLNLLKNLSNKTNICIVALGTESAIYALNSDDQLANRFHSILLPNWKKDDDYYKLLSTFSKFIPLKNQVGMISKEVSDKIYEMSEGILGEIIEILKKSSSKVIISGEEVISLNTLKSIDYIMPSLRKNGVLVR